MFPSSSFENKHPDKDILANIKSITNEVLLAMFSPTALQILITRFMITTHQLDSVTVHQPYLGGIHHAVRNSLAHLN